MADTDKILHTLPVRVEARGPNEATVYIIDGPASVRIRMPNAKPCSKCGGVAETSMSASRTGSVMGMDYDHKHMCPEKWCQRCSMGYRWCDCEDEQPEAP